MNEITISPEWISEQFKTLESRIVESVIRSLNLDNGIAAEKNIIIESSLNGDDLMASKVRRNYNYVDENGNECSIRINASSEQEADVKFQEFLLKDKTTARKEKAILFKDYVVNNYIPKFVDSLKESTKANYKMYIELYIIPFLGDLRIDKITTTDIQKFYDWMAGNENNKRSLNEKTIERVGGLCKRIFSIAAEEEFISEVPFKVKLLVNKGRASGHHKALPDELISEIKRKIPNMENICNRLYAAILVYTGVRKEELLGLRWEDVDFQNQCCTIKRAVTYPGNNHPCIDTPKSKRSYRTIVLPTALLNILEPAKQSDGFVFGGEEPWSYSRQRRTFLQIRKELGFEGYDNHDFRTTFATQICEMGISSKQCADMMGHADTRMVETVYAPARREGALKNLKIIEELNKNYTANQKK